MKQYIYSAATLLCLSSFALTSCQNEMEDMGNVAGKEVLLRVTANRGDAATRTTLEPNATGGLTCKWSEGDQLLVVSNSTGKKIGVITLVGGAETSEGTFEGNVTLDDLKTVSLVYLGTTTDAEDYSSDLNKVAIDLSEQDGTLASLTDKDVLTAEVEISDNTYVQKKGNVVQATVTLTRQLAHGYFQLDFSEVGDFTLAAEDVITVIGEGLRTEGNVNFKNGGNFAIPTNYIGSKTITITKKEKGNDFYVTMLPVGDMSPVFIVEKDGEVYMGALGSHKWIANEYVRKDAQEGVKVKMHKRDNKILGLQWADVNVRSWIDWSNTNDFAFYFSYIPDIPLKEQGIYVNYTGGNIENGTVNPYVFHYQWGRNFGFAASTGDLSGVKLPNWANKPNSWASKYAYYQTIQGPGSPAQSVEYVDYFIWTTGNDWCNKNMSSWPVNVDDDGGKMSVTPDGFRLPTKKDFELLLPSGTSGAKFTSQKSFIVDGETIRPVYAKKTTEGTTVVWAILNSSTNYMALYELPGEFTLDQLNQTLFDGGVLDYVDFPAHGCRSGNQAATLQYYQSEGWYWAGTSSATGYADILRFTISNNSLTIYVAGMPRKSALSVRCIYED